jgi:serine protease Do
MIVSRWGALAGALLLAAPVAAPARAAAQEREPLVRAFEFAGRGARIGVTVAEIEGDDAKAAKSGVVVESVSTGSPAEKAGIKVGDAITEFDGERVRSVMQFSRLVQETASGRSVAVALSRGGQRMTVNVTPETRTLSDDFNMRLLDLPRAPRTIPTPTPPAAPLASPRFSLLARGGRLGITIEALDDQLAEYFGVKDGVLVKSVTTDSAAQKAGLKAGDVITAINGSKVYETSDVSRLINRVEGDGSFTVDVMRDKKPLSLKGKVETPETRPRARARARTVI